MNETGFTFSVNANGIHELRDILADASDQITYMFDAANRAAHEQDLRDAAFIRFCFTGRFD